MGVGTKDAHHTSITKGTTKNRQVHTNTAAGKSTISTVADGPEGGGGGGGVMGSTAAARCNGGGARRNGGGARRNGGSARRRGRSRTGPTVAVAL